MKKISPRSSLLEEVPYKNFELVRTRRSKLFSIPRKILPAQKYYAIEVLEGNKLDEEHFTYFAGDNSAYVAILMSSLFPIWVNAIDEKADELNPEIHYNNFPFPKITRKQKTELDTASKYIFSARGKSEGNTLSDIYWKNEMSETLLFAHERLDDLVLDIFGLPRDATNEEIADFLIKRWEELTSRQS